MVGYLSIFLAAVAAMVLGTLWYGPLFGKQWMRLSGINSKKISESAKKGMWKAYLANFISALVMIYILSWLLDYTKTSSLVDALFFSFLVWFGFMATTSIGSILWEGKPKTLWIINNGYNLINLLIVAIILVLI